MPQEVTDALAFLCARVRELEGDLIDGDTADQYYGHVVPALARAEATLREHDAPADGWRAVKSPPRAGDWVLIAENTGTWMDVAMFRGGKWWQFNNSTHLREITDIVFAYWRPLPDPPETNNV